MPGFSGGMKVPTLGQTGPLDPNSVDKGKRLLNVKSASEIDPSPSRFFQFGDEKPNLRLLP
jgi:hypothetical protein